MKNNKRVTIAIVSYNGRKDLAECLPSVFSQNYPSDLLRIILIDNNSKDSTVDFVREKYPSIKIIENGRNVGFAEANNQAYYLAQKSNSDYFVLLNQDTVVSQGWLNRLVDIAERDKNIAAVQPKLMLYRDKDKINSLGNAIHFLGFAYCNHYGEEDKSNIVDKFLVPYPSGAACLLRMSALRKLGLFDDRLFMYHEDVDLGWRLRLAGFKVVVDPLSVVYHDYSFSKAKYKFYYMERNRLIVALENYRVLTLILFFPAWLFMELGLLFFALKNGWLKEKIAGYFWIVGHFFSILGRRISVQFRIRKVKDREILSIFTGKIMFQEVSYWPLTYLVNPLLSAYFWLARKIIFW